MPKHSQLRIRSLQICKGFLQLLLQWARKVGLRLRVNAISHTWSVASRLLHTNGILFWYIVSMSWFLQVIVCSLLSPASFPQDLRLTCAETHFGMLVFAWLMQPKRQPRWNLDWLPTNWCNCRDDKSWRQNWTLKVLQKRLSEVRPVPFTTVDQPETNWHRNAEPSLGTVDGIISGRVLELSLYTFPKLSNVQCAQ